MTVSFLMLLGIAVIAGIAILNIILLILEWLAATIIDLIWIARKKPHDLHLILHDVRSIATKIMLSVSFGMDSPKQVVRNDKRTSQIVRNEIDKYLKQNLKNDIYNDLKRMKSKEFHSEKH